MDFASSFSSVSEKTEATSRRMFPFPRAEAFAWKQMNIPSTHRVMTVVAVTTETGPYSTSTLDESWLLIRHVIDELYMIVGRFNECAISLEIEIHSVFIHPLVDRLDHVGFELVRRLCLIGWRLAQWRGRNGKSPVSSSLLDALFDFLRWTLLQVTERSGDSWQDDERSVGGHQTRIILQVVELAAVVLDNLRWIITFEEDAGIAD